MRATIHFAHTERDIKISYTLLNLVSVLIKFDYYNYFILNTVTDKNGRD